MPLPTRLDAALLYPAQPQVDFAAIAASVNAIMAPSGLSLEVASLKPGKGAKLKGDTPGGTITLTIALSPKPMPESRLATAMASDYGRLQGADWPTTCSQHRAFLAVVAEARGKGSGGQQSFETLLALTQIAAEQLAMEALPLAVYWGQSNQLFSSERFMAMADVLFPLPLFIHPRPFSSGRMAEGTQCMGVRLDHAEQVLGRALVFREAPSRLPYILDRAYAFIDHCRATGRILGDGAEFGAGPSEVIRVSHHGPGPEHPTGHIALTLRELDGVLLLQPDGENNAPGIASARADSAPPHPPPTRGPPAEAVNDFFSTPDAKARARHG